MTETSCCSLGPAELAQQADAWRSLAANLIDARSTATGAVLRYRLEPGTAERLLALVDAERRCCPSLSFSVQMAVRIDAPEEARSWVTETFVQPQGHPPELSRDGIEEAVREHYAAAARGVSEDADPRPAACCSQEGIGAGSYQGGELDELPAPAVAASIGCANPVAVARLAPGETVLDLGSGGGIDVLLSARRVGPTGKAYGLDMTEEMLELARANQARAGLDNVEFLRGRIEAVPLPDASVDVVVSNCVVALSTDKAAVFSEAYRVLRPGGRLALADVVAEVAAPPDPGDGAAEWVACSAGALGRERYRAGLESAGFLDVSIADSHRVGDSFTSVIVSAVKPAP